MLPCRRLSLIFCLLIFLIPIDQKLVQPTRHRAKLLQKLFQEEKNSHKKHSDQSRLLNSSSDKMEPEQPIPTPSPEVPELTEEIRRFTETGAVDPPSPINEMNFSLSSRGGENQNSLASSITKALSFNKNLIVLQSTLISSKYGLNRGLGRRNEVGRTGSCRRNDERRRR